jgi:hypothetical protein
VNASTGFESRTSTAISDVVRFARGCGLEVGDHVLLRSTNNVVVWLKPAPVVAKIGLGKDPRLHRELQVALELQASSAPSVHPSPLVPTGVHARGGVDFTFWTYHEQSSADISQGQLAAQLRRLHNHLAQLSPALRGRLPTCLDEARRARELLSDPSSLPALGDQDRGLLADAYDTLESALQSRVSVASYQVIHGSPHLYNALSVDGEVRFIDFETACLGPLEWDAAFLAGGSEPDYGTPLDSHLLWICRSLISVMTAAFCWSDPERGDLREHAQMHLAHVREHVVGRLSGNPANT